MNALALAWALLGTASAVEVVPFPAERLVPLLPADPYETGNALLFRSGDPPLEGTVGDTLGLVRFELGALTLQADLGAAIFLGFLPGEAFTFGIATVDGIIRVPITATWKRWQLSLEWAHVSAHYADGVRYGENLPPKDSDGYSRESLRLVASAALPWVQPYLGVRELVHVIPQAERFGVQAGCKAHGLRKITWYQALDLAWNAEHDWQTRASYQGGVLLRSDGPRALRVGGVAFHGPALAGKRDGETDRYLGAVLGFDWHGGWNTWTGSEI